MKYFKEEELRIKDASLEVKVKMLDLVENVLDPLREKVGAIKVTSGYRSPEYNAKVGGVNDTKTGKVSQHTKGEACDIVPLKTNIEEVFAIIAREFPYDQLIIEDNGFTKWIHVSFKRGKNRRQKLSAKKIDGVWKYTPV